MKKQTIYEWLKGLDVAERGRVLQGAARLAKRIPDMAPDEIAESPDVCPQAQDRTWYMAHWPEGCGGGERIPCKACCLSWLKSEKRTDE